MTSTFTHECTNQIFNFFRLTTVLNLHLSSVRFYLELLNFTTVGVLGFCFEVTVFISFLSSFILCSLLGLGFAILLSWVILGDIGQLN